MTQDVLTWTTWKWQGPDPARQFPAAAVNVLYAMIDRNFHAPFRLVCFTDDPTGIDGAVDVQPLPQTKADHLLAPPQDRKLWPACWRRLWLFSKDAMALGPRICNIDLDVIIVQDITTLIQSKQADFVGWSCGRHAWNRIGGALWLHTPGTHTEVWDKFDPATSPQVAHAQGHRGSDQSWLSHMLYPPVQKITEHDGVLKLNWLPHAGRAPGPDVRMIFTVGTSPPWAAATQLKHRWITEHWRR
jgi:hypothetical protein